MTTTTRARLLDEARSSDLPVVAVNNQPLARPDAPQGRRHAAITRRTIKTLRALRATGLTGEVRLCQYAPSLLGAMPIFIETTAPSGRVWLLDGEFTVWGGVRSGPLANEARAFALVDGGQKERGTSWVALDRGPEQLLNDLRASLHGALAEGVWDQVLTEFDPLRSVRLLRYGKDGASHILSTDGPAGHVVVTVTNFGEVASISQYDRGRPIRGTGAFGRYLNAEFTKSLNVKDPAMVFGAFLRALDIAVEGYLVTVEGQR